MPHKHHMQWPLSARGERPRLSVLTPPNEKSDGSVNLPPYPNDNEEARALVASRLWGGSRRYSDSSSQLSDRALFHQSLDRHDLANRTGLSFFVSDAPPLSPVPREVDLGGSITHLQSPVQSPTRISAAALRYTPVAVQTIAHQSKQISKTQEPDPTKDAFISWNEYTAHSLPRRLPSSSTTHRDDMIKAVSSLSVNKLPIKNVGKLARPVMNKYYRTDEALASFTATTERTILLPNPSVLGPTPSQRLLERLESDLFNASKYLSSSSSSHSQNLTVLTWSDDSPWGTATLFEVSLPQHSSSTPPPPGIGLLARRRRDTSLSLRTAADSNHAVTIKPLAAMELIPRNLLVQFRLDQTLRKLSISHTNSQFKWTSTAGSRSPSYATLLDPEDGTYPQPETEQPTSLLSAMDDDIDFILGPRSRYRKHLHPSDPRLLFDSAEVEVEADGIISTLPQFLALLHTQLSIIEVIDSTPITTTDTKVETVSGRKVRGVSLRDWPKGKKHTGRDVHVVVLVPEGAEWAEESIFWSDDAGSLRELRAGRRYGSVIKRERRGRGRRRRRREDDASSAGWDGRDGSPLGSARSAAW
ncbi:hypothetical protein QBC44DRAFT_273565 [Cladorrhinum sp. PSN332]|nr:hypothetical protein QBC44DRAFT_273565 [Cladorrhinum sp. PSN332]